MSKPTLDERLKIYANDKNTVSCDLGKYLFAAGALAGVGAILVPPPAEAAIVYSGLQNKTVSAAQTYQTVDFDGQGVSPDFIFWFSSNGTTNALGMEVPTGSFSVIATDYEPGKLAKGEIVSSNAGLSVMSVGILATNGAGSTSGNFLNSRGYLGVKFEIDGTGYRGWIQYQANATASVGTIIDWAYEDTPGEDIKTGDTGKKFNWLPFIPAITGAGRN